MEKRNDEINREVGRTVNSGAAVVYARVSSKEQEKGGFSVPAQRKLLMEYAASEGLSVLREFVDIETAKLRGY